MPLPENSEKAIPIGHAVIGIVAAAITTYTSGRISAHRKKEMLFTEMSETKGDSQDEKDRYVAYKSRT